jgi:serine/threonine protein kinase
VSLPSLQIADFGLSQLMEKGKKMTKVCGTWAYAAPEMFDPMSGGYDAKFDTWGFGVILFVVLCGYHPFDPEGGLPVPEVC